MFEITEGVGIPWPAARVVGLRQGSPVRERLVRHQVQRHRGAVHRDRVRQAREGVDFPLSVDYEEKAVCSREKSPLILPP